MLPVSARNLILGVVRVRGFPPSIWSVYYLFLVEEWDIWNTGWCLVSFAFVPMNRQ